MKKLFWILLLLALALPAQAETITLYPGDFYPESFYIDEGHVYANMTRPYSQGYAPGVKSGTMRVVVPIVSHVAVGSITAELIPASPENAPYKLENLTWEGARKTVEFADGDMEVYLVTFKLSLYSDRVNGEYPFSVRVQGVNAMGQPVSGAFDFLCEITDGRMNAEEPRLSVENFSVGDAYLPAGEDAVISFDIKNESASRSVRDVTIALSEGTGDVIPQTSDTVFAGDLIAGETRHIEIPVRVALKAASAPHTIAVSVSSAYGNGQKSEFSRRFTADIRQNMRLEHSQAELPVRVVQGDVSSFSMDLMNMGRSEIRNALLTFDVPGLSAGASVLAGTVDPGATKTATANFRVSTSAPLGFAEGSVTLSWEDEYGEVYSKVLPLSTTIEEKVIYTPEVKEEKENPVLKYLPWGALALSWILIIPVLVTRQRKIRRLEEKGL